MILSKNFRLIEFTRSQYAEDNRIENTPNSDQIRNIKYLCDSVLQPLRDYFDDEVNVTSGFRNPVVNRGVGGVKSSDHLCEGRVAAADIQVKGKTTEEVMEAIIFLKLPVKQVIDEFDRWVHVSIEMPEFEYLEAYKVNGKTRYRVYPSGERV